MFENTSKCEDCLYYEYDDEYGFYVCDMDLDEDETAQFIGGRFQNCPRTTAPATNTPSSASKYNNIV